MSDHGIIIRVPHTPHMALNPNNSGHHAVVVGRERVTRAELRRTLRQSAKLATQSHLVRHPWRIPRGRIGIELVVAWERGRIKPNRPFPDDDNLIASCKALVDGIADGLGVNDKRFKFLGIEQEIDPEGDGYVAVTLTPWKER